MLDHPKRDTRDTSLYHPLTRPLRPEERSRPARLAVADVAPFAISRANT